MPTIEERVARLEARVFGASSPTPLPPPPPPPPPPAAGTRDDAIIAQVRALRAEGGRGSVLASMFLQYAQAGSRLEPRLSREIPNYAHWLDWKSYGAPHNQDILVPSAEWDRMQAMVRALPPR
jgi:hypothetical protein